MNCPKEMQVDHINGDRLDNRKDNLRICTEKQNRQNRKKISGKTSKYKGVHWNKLNKNWRARIIINDKSIDLGSFKKEIQAAKVYNKAALTYFKEYAKLNRIKGGPIGR